MLLAPGKGKHKENERESVKIKLNEKLSEEHKRNLLFIICAKYKLDEREESKLKQKTHTGQENIEEKSNEEDQKEMK